MSVIECGYSIMRSLWAIEDSHAWNDAACAPGIECTTSILTPW